MKKKLRISALFLGVIVAILSFSDLYADNQEQTEAISTIETLKEVAALIVKDTFNECAAEERIKIYNSSCQLVYECRGGDDQRLKILLRRSDLLWHTDSSSYYLLGD